MVRFSKSLKAGLVCACAVLSLCVPTAAAAQDHRAIVFVNAGGASIVHADSEQGKAPIFGGGAGFHLTPRFLIEGDVHGARVTQVFGREHHDFSQVTVTGSVLFRSSPRGRAHFIAGAGWGLQRAHIDFTLEPHGRIERTETIGLLHGRVGAEWDLSSRIALRTEGVLWFGEGVDGVLGARAGLGYRF
ncbi:MAG: outer membrane beta-barrel protein [Vicinamibacterales bacterium]